MNKQIEEISQKLNNKDNLSQKEKTQLMKDIKNLKDALTKEYRLLEQEENDARFKETMTERKQYVGKCFALKTLSPSTKIQQYSKSYPNVYAFKILSIDESNSSYARCLTLCDGYNNGTWKEVGFINQVLGLWTSDVPRMLSLPNDKKTIELFSEIDETKFNSLKQELYNKIEKL